MIDPNRLGNTAYFSAQIPGLQFNFKIACFAELMCHLLTQSPICIKFIIVFKVPAHFQGIRGVMSVGNPRLEYKESLRTASFWINGKIYLRCRIVVLNQYHRSVAGSNRITVYIHPYLNSIRDASCHYNFGLSKP